MEGVPLADLMKRGTVTASAPVKVSEPRSDMHQNTEELLRQLADFRESKKVAAQAPTVVSSVVQEYAPVYVAFYLILVAMPDILPTPILPKCKRTQRNMERIKVLTLLLTPLIHLLRTLRRPRFLKPAPMDLCLLRAFLFGEFLPPSSRLSPPK
jgi:hypothetical protein